MAREPQRPDAALPVLDLNELGFWAGYRAWLRLRRARVFFVCGLLLLLFIFGLWFSATPQDPFSYDLF